MKRTQTIMRGARHCEFRYRVAKEQGRIRGRAGVATDPCDGVAWRRIKVSKILKYVLRIYNKRIT